MQVSATILGKSYGLTGQEMNRVLQKLGYLSKVSDGYDITDKAIDYVVEKCHHRGPGGYSRYNVDWVTRTFDDSIKEVITITPELINEVKTELTSERTARYAALVAARAQANADFLAKQATENIIENTDPTFIKLNEETLCTLKKSGIIGIAAIGTILLAYGVYKVTPKIKAKLAKNKEQKNIN